MKAAEHQIAIVDTSVGAPILRCHEIAFVGTPLGGRPIL